MALFKCKMCGGTIEFEEGATVGVCDSCGTKQTLPKTNDDVVANLFNRANNLRLKSEFDKAEQIYERIVEQDDSEAEAHWGIVLCRYGIEYVEDPTTHERIPTCHRTMYEPVTQDVDYIAAIDYSDTLQQAIYEKEARAIDRIQKGILEIVKKEDPFDVFICYKETDENGKRTIDSVLANDLYHQLTQEGFKVFFSRITLEDKLGTAYEPYIFAALNSAKVMVVLGTKPEYFNAVWVKNEWNRYLSLVKQSNGKKVLIPAYRDMDPYDLPEEFSHLQAQDMSKLGFMQDLIRGIKKLVGTESDATESISKKGANLSPKNESKADPLVKRAFMFLEDEEYEKADSYLERALDVDPENAEAYLGKLLVGYAVTVDDLFEFESPWELEELEEDDDYQRMMRFAEGEFKERINTYLEKARETFKKQEEKERKAFEALKMSHVKRMKDMALEWINDEISSLKRKSEEYKKVIARLVEKKETIFAALRDKERVDLEETKIRKELIRQRALYDEQNIFAIKKKKDIQTEIEALEHSLDILEEEKKKAESLSEGFKEIADYEKKFAEMRSGIDAIEQQIKDLVSVKDDTNDRDLEEIYIRRLKKQLSDAKVGDMISLGGYNQRGDEWEAAPAVEWKILSKESGKALLISTSALECKPYNNREREVTWEDCSLREWLNSTFYNVAFSLVEQGCIVKTTVFAENNPDYSTSPGNDTQDKVFLLSIQEAKKYFKSDVARICKGTESCLAKIEEIRPHDGSINWWLRSPGNKPSYAAYVMSGGRVYASGMWVTSTIHMVRPVLWINYGS